MSGVQSMRNVARNAKRSVIVTCALSGIVACVLCLSAGVAWGQRASATQPVSSAPSSAATSAPNSLEATSKPIEESSASLQWFDSLDAGYMAAQAAPARPMLVLIADRSSEPAQEFERVLIQKYVTAHIDQWVLVRIAPDSPEAVRSMGVAMPPALRAMTSGGTIVVRRAGLPSAQSLETWLANAMSLAKPSAPSTEKSKGDVADLVGKLSSRDVAIREAAARQLQGRRNDAAGALVEALSSDDLTTRITAADVLEGWDAPIADIDPWQRATLTPERRDALRKWAGELASLPTAAPTDDASVSAPISPEASTDLDQLLACATAGEARAIRERMIRYGAAILPEVYRRLQATSDEESRHRLTALRYRLVASDALASDWPGAFDLLASSDEGTRRAAMKELGSRAKSGDSRLLVELFSDDDPLVREQALRLLRSLGGTETTGALVKLLADPDANVRAAVLKVLSEEGQTSASLATEIAKYAAAEPDADLVVHAIHVLKALPGSEALRCLVTLLGHKDWRVRADAAVAVHEKLGRSYREPVSDEDSTKAYTALIALLDDEEGFVISRAMSALDGTTQVSAIEPMLRAIDRHPELTEHVFKILSESESLGTAALPKIRKLCRSERADVRAVALKTLCQVAPQQAQAELTLAMDDPDAGVRAAGVAGILQVLDKQWPEGGYVTHTTLFGLGGSRTERVNLSKWLEDFHAGKGRPAWMIKLVPALEKAMTASPEPSATQAAVALCALGTPDTAFPRLLAAAKVASLLEQTTNALHWLSWEQREQLFKALFESVTPEQRAAAVRGLATIPDPRAAPLIWDALANVETDKGLYLLDTVCNSLRTVYFSDGYYVFSDDGNRTPNLSAQQASEQKTAREACLAQIDNGNELQRVVALSILMQYDAANGAIAAQKVLDDPKASVVLREDAMIVRLHALPAEQRDAEAIKAMKDPVTAEIGLSFLAVGPDAISKLHHTIYINSMNNFSNRGKPITVAPPKGLTADMVKPFLADADAHPELAAYASYFLVLLGENDAFPRLEAMWRSQTDEDRQWSKLVYRAIVKMNDESRTPILEEIKHSYENTYFEINDFYWTIATMKQLPAVNKLRQQIEKEGRVQLNRFGDD